ncbi:MAG TPA: hypothetical protein PLM93_00305 [Sulfuricurvum sp.]|nr:MAG: hypothetical protein B7Y30_11540 [Campylobacterales bacterium 16-40-21]OZA03869.1 MAG: hypothetical protein B7X89_04130 [Sulfuricurvum sp. 17-40-25]HQS65611.1 hypothetical protein [Sulfuricurvum sp.]HQT36225.1 hypothetical protein [Sulfuricurvum sp.]
MDAISSNTVSSPEIFALKKAIEVQEQGVMKVLESAQAPVASSNSGSSLTGIGQTLDLRA